MNITEVAQRASDALCEAFRSMAAAVQPALEALNQFAASVVVNRRARRAMQRGDWAALSWYIEDHDRRDLNRTVSAEFVSDPGDLLWYAQHAITKCRPSTLVFTGALDVER